MSDVRIRDLERRVAAGDEAAAEELRAELRRAGQGEPPCERCSTWHPPARVPYCYGPINLERATELAQASAAANHPHPTRLGKPVNMSPLTAQRLAIRRQNDVARTLAWVEQEAETGHQLASLRSCDGCQAFLVVNRPKLHRWSGHPTWRDRARYAISIVQLLLAPCATAQEKRAMLAVFRVRAQGDAWTSKVWGEEVRRAFPELARKRKSAQQLPPLSFGEPAQRPMFGGQGG